MPFGELCGCDHTHNNLYKIDCNDRAQDFRIVFEDFLPLIVLNVKIIANGHQFLAHLVAGGAAALGTQLAVFFHFLSSFLPSSASHIRLLTPSSSLYPL